MSKGQGRNDDRIDAILDDMRNERRIAVPGNSEEAELVAVARLVRTLRPQPLLPAGLGDRIAAGLTNKTPACRQSARVQATWHTRRPLRLVLGGIAAALVLFIGFAVSTGLWRGDVAHAMSRAVAKIASYHGVLEKSYQAESGEGHVVRRVEVWSWSDGYATRLEDGTLTVNNGQAKWQIRPSDEVVAVLPIAPDPDRSGLDLRVEAERALKYPHVEAGEEIVAGREAVRLKVTPPGGQAYEVWVDRETNLPLQLRTALQNGIQTTYTYTEFEAGGVDGSGFTYAVPKGYSVVEDDPGQIVATPAEAAGIAGFGPLMPEDRPLKILAHASGRIVLDFGATAVVETQAAGEFMPASHGAIGTAAGGPLEIVEGSLRWRQAGLELTVEGSGRLEVARQIAPDLTLPDGMDAGFRPEVAVQVDMEVAKNDQKQVDGGHSPWQLDPLSVSLTFVNLMVTPGGIVGEAEIPYESFAVKSNDGVRAVVGVSEGPVENVYLERLVRQDDSGIWSVVGYDPS